MTQHTAISPDECRSCVRVFDVLSDHHHSQRGKLRNADLVARLEERRQDGEPRLGDRATRVHVAHLQEHSRIGEDRRTPLPGMTVAPAQEIAPSDIWTPLDYVLTVTCRDRTCRRMLVILARSADATWGGQMGLAQLADLMGCSLRTAGTHRRHLSEDGLVRLTEQITTHASGHITRSPDRYLLLSGLITAGTAGESWEEDAARDVLAQITWWTGGTKAERQKAVWKILKRLRNGWSVADILTHVDIVPGRPVIHRLGLLESLLPGANEPRPVPAFEHVTDRAIGPVLCAAGCGRQFPHSSGVMPGKVCRVCREERTEEASSFVFAGPSSDPAF
ncbi:hypothetical protein AB0H73_35720 [Streptomyces olivoreticuli]